MPHWIAILGITCLVPIIMGGLVLLLDEIVQRNYKGPYIEDYIRKIVNEELLKYKNIK